MPQDENNGTERRKGYLEIPVPWSGKSIIIRGISAIMAALLVVNIALAAFVWTHEDRDSLREQTFIKILSEQNAILKEMIYAQREFTCTIRTPQEGRQDPMVVDRCYRDARKP